MKKRLMCFCLFIILVSPLWAQYDEPAETDSKQVKRYANMPDEAIPYRRFTKPYQDWFIQTNTIEYNGAAQDRKDGDPSKLSEIAIGFLGPLENNYESLYGVPMLHGVQLAIEQTNARGGYKGKPFALKIHNDSALWGASSTEILKMLFNENCWAMLGSIDGQSTHIALRVSLKVEVPIMDTGTTDPTVTETRIQWLMHNFPDDRQQGYTLADYVFKNLKLKRIGVLRTQSRYARIGVAKFNDEARRMGRQPVLEVKFDRGDKDFARQLRMLKEAKIEGLVIWGEAPEAGLILKQMREMGMKQPVFGGSRLAYQQLVDLAGPAADGIVLTTTLDPTRSDPKWLSFREAYRQRYNEEPIDYAAYAYDGINILISTIEKVGLNRGRIMAALRDFQLKDYEGVAGTAHFDHTLNNISPITMARIKNGKFEYWVAPRQGGHEGSATGGQ